MLDNNIIIQPYQLKSSKVMKTPHGLTILEIVNQMYNQSNVPAVRRNYNVMVEINGTPIPRDKWDIVPDLNSHVLISTIMHGGDEQGNKTILRVVMMLAVVVLAIYSGGAAAGAMGFVQGSVATGTQFAITSSLVSMAVMTAGTLLINAIAPIRPLDASTGTVTNPKQVYSITGSQNKANLFGTIPVVLGRHKMYPIYGAAPYTEVVGNEEYLRMLFIWGYGPLKIEDIKIGDTLLTQYAEYEIENREGRPDDAPITLMTESVHQQPVNLELVQPADDEASLIVNGFAWEPEVYGDFAPWKTTDCSLSQGSDGVSGVCGVITSTGGAFQDLTQKIGSKLSKDTLYQVSFYVKLGTSTSGAGSAIVRSKTNPNNIVKQLDFTATGDWEKKQFTFYRVYGDEEIVFRKNSSHSSYPGTMKFDSISLYKADYSGLGWGEIVKTIEGADEISVDILFPGGLFQIDSEGARTTAQADIHIEWRVLGTQDWLPVFDKDWKENTTKPIRYGYRWSEGVSRDQTYEVRIVRYLYYTTGLSRITNTIIWTSIKSIVNEHPVDFNLPLAMTALRIRATKQLNGIINQLSGVVTSYVTGWNGTSWEGEVLSQNPAALFRSVLVHPANVRARDVSQINDAELGEWYDFCETEGFKFNMIRETATSVWDTLADIASVGRGSPSLAEGLWGVVYDRMDTPVVQHITPRNSWGFSSSKVLFHPPHGFRIEFRNEDNDWEDDERIVLDDGYYLNTKDALNNPISIDAFGRIINSENTELVEATQFESISLIGVTYSDLIWRFGRFHIAQARLRPEVYTLSMDFEHLVCRRGSKVLVSHDVPMWGNKWGRIKSIVTESVVEYSGDAGYFSDQSGGASWEDTQEAVWDKGTTITKVIGVKLDEKFSITNSSQYVMRVRRSDDDTSQIINISPLPIGEYDTVIFESPVDVGDPIIPPIGDLVIIGEITKETNECLVKSITASDDLTATLELVDLGSAIYEADQGEIPPFDTHITREPDFTLIVPMVPNILSIQSGTETLELGINGYLSPRIFVTCGVDQTDIRIGSYEVRYKLPDGENWTSVFCISDDPTAICRDVFEGLSYHISARSISIFGIKSDWIPTITHTVIGQSELPSDVTNFTCNILGTEAHLSWYPVFDIDLSHYRIRWSPLTDGAVWEDSIDIVQRVAVPATTVTVPAMVGSYLIKAVDYKGNESGDATIATASIIRIPGFTNAETISQPTWSGTGENTEYDVDMGGVYLSLSPIGENLITNGEDFTSTTGYNNFDDDPNCVSRYRFEAGDFTSDDKGTNALSASTSSPTLSTDSKEGNASADLELDNTQYFYRNDADLSSDFPFKSGTSNNKMTVCAWVKAESFAIGSNLNTIVSKYDTGTSKRSFSFRIKENGSGVNVLGVMIGYNSGASYEELTLHGTDLSLNTWYHATFSFDDSDKSYAIRLRDQYGNVLGTDITGTATNNVNKSDEPFRIGVQFYGGSPYSGSRFDGLIDEVVIFKDILTASEVTSIAKGDYVSSSTPTDWSGENCSVVATTGGESGDCIQLTSVSGDLQQINHASFDLVIGKLYRLTAHIKSGTSGDDAYQLVADGDTENQGIASGTSSSSWVLDSLDFECIETPVTIKLRKNTSHASSPGTMLFDTVRLYELGTSLSGLYTLSDEVDLGGIYTARISASLTTSAANLFQDLYDYGDLYDAENLYGVPIGKCGVELELRTTQDDPGGTPTWTEWSKVIVGDFTARGFQFRMRLWSADLSITPIVQAVDIYVDLADRTQGFDQEISSSGEDVVFALPFFAPPSLSISVANQGSATYTITNHTRTGFHIQFTSGTQNISGVAKGYGLEEV